MEKQSSWKRLLIGGVAATAVVAGVAAFTLTPNIVSAQDATTETPAVEDGARHFGRRGPGGPGGFGPMGMQAGDRGKGGELLAEALEIPLEELEAAQEAVKEAAIAQAIEDGVITQEQADQMAERSGRFGGRGFPMMGHSGRGMADVDHDALLAEQLDISVEALQAAKDEARQAGLEQAIEDGYVTEEQAEQIETMHAVRDYVDHKAIFASALNMTVEELDAAHEDGNLHDLIEEAGLDRDAIKDAMQAGFEAAVAQAVADGVITQEQADSLQDGGFGGSGLFPGRGGRGFPGMGPGGFERGEGFERGDGERVGPRDPGQRQGA